MQKADAAVREQLRLPERASPNRDFAIGGAPLEWSIHRNVPPARDGYIYMHHPLSNSTPLWEFALSTQRSLLGVKRADLRCEFYGMGDLRGSQVFGTNWGGHTILVPEGQIFFARLITNRRVVYVIQLLRQGGTPYWGSIRIRYFSVTNLPPSTTAQPTSALLLRSTVAAIRERAVRSTAPVDGCGSVGGDGERHQKP